MKHIFLAAITFALLISSSAYAQVCSIYLWNDDGSLKGGPIATNELSRTIISTEEAALFLDGDNSLDGCSDQCCYDRNYINDGYSPIWDIYVRACISGTYYGYTEICGYPYPCSKSTYNGTWDVVCDDADLDGIYDDGDNSSASGDNPCTGGNTLSCDDNCRLTANPDQADMDEDSVGDVCDNCPADWNPSQWDGDFDGIGDVCDTETDSDGDGVADPYDNCPALFNPLQKDVDNDGMGNACDTILNANYSINLAADFADLSGVTEITGNLIIRTTALTNLTGLEALTIVGGDLYIRSNYVLTNLESLSNLTSVGGYLYIGANYVLTSLTGLENLTSVGGYLSLEYNFALTNLESLSNLTSVGGYLSLRDNPLTSLTGLESLTSVGGDLKIRSLRDNALTSLTGLENLTSVGGDLYISFNPALTSLTGLENLTSVGGWLDISDNDALTSLSGLYGVQLAGNLYLIDNANLCMETAQLLEDQLRLNGYIGRAYIGGNNGTICPPEIYNVTTNQGPEGSLIPLEGLPVFSLASEKIQWIAEDSDAEPELGEWWEWTLGIDHSYVSYWKEDMGGYSPETELTLNDDVTGYSGRWKYVSPVSYLPGDGWYSIKLIAEDMDGNRSEATYSIRVDTSATDTDSAGIPDSSDNCPENCNAQQLDADGDGIGDVCDDPGDDGCLSCGNGEICELEC